MKDAVDVLNKRIAELEDELDESVLAGMELAGEIRLLKAENERLRQDAEQYRLVREQEPKLQRELINMIIRASDIAI